MVDDGAHRDAVGGLWEEIGKLSFDFLRSQGLSSSTTVLDIGCGCLRVGVYLVRYLEPGRYFGVDISEDLLEVGYERELRPLGLAGKLPRHNLLCDSEFRFERLPGAPLFEMALAQSVFTHLPLNHIRLCLARLGPLMETGGRFFATVFHCPSSVDWTEPMQHAKGGITTYPTQDPYHYCAEDLKFAAQGLGWKMSGPADWSHPRDQSMVVFTRS
jgi:SAM-dependent methyltransferase